MKNLNSSTAKTLGTDDDTNHPDAGMVKTPASETSQTVVFRLELGKPLQVETISGEFHSKGFHDIRWMQLIVVAKYFREISAIVLKVDSLKITPTEILGLGSKTKIGLCGSIDMDLSQENRDELEKCHIYFLAMATDNCMGLSDDLFHAIPVDVGESGYRAWKRGGKPYRKRLTDTQTLALIRAIHAEFKEAYGSPRD